MTFRKENWYVTYWCPIGDIHTNFAIRDRQTTVIYGQTSGRTDGQA